MTSFSQKIFCFITLRISYVKMVTSNGGRVCISLLRTGPKSFIIYSKIFYNLRHFIAFFLSFFWAKFSAPFNNIQKFISHCIIGQNWPVAKQRSKSYSKNEPHWENYISISFHIEWDMIVVTVFLTIFNQMEFHLVQNWKENCHQNHIPFNLRGNGILVLSE